MLNSMARSGSGPMFSNTIDVTGLELEDAVELVYLKVQRARAADVDVIRVVHGANAGKLRRLLEQRMQGPRQSATVDTDPESATVTWILLSPLATVPTASKTWLTPRRRSDAPFERT